MNYSAPLYLASKSPTRRRLLEEAQIPFTVLEQSADETYDKKQSPLDIVKSIAQAKSTQIYPPPITTDCFVLTADTICVDYKGTIHGKPKDRNDAVTMLQLWRHGSEVLTGFCLEKKVWSEGLWHTDSKIIECVCSSVTIDIPDQWIDEYLTHSGSLAYAGAMTVEGYGALFITAIEGSHSNILGLPLCEVRQALTQLGFFMF